jgi:hypothetical protein
MLELFIETFLPKQENKRKYSGNEIEYISNTLNRIFQKQFGFKLTTKEILGTFEKMGYNIYNKFSSLNSENKNFKPSTQGDCIRFDSPYKENNAAFIYVNVSSAFVRQLWLTTTTLPPNTNMEKLLAINALKREIEKFKQEWKSLKG